MLRRLVVALQCDRGYVSKVSTTRLLVDRTLIELWIPHIIFEVDGKDVDNRDWNKQYFGCGFGPVSYTHLTLPTNREV